jgi:hypothetical protein
MGATSSITTAQLNTATIFAGSLAQACALTLPTAAAGRSLTLMIQTGATPYTLTLDPARQAGAATVGEATDAIAFSANSTTLIVCTVLITAVGNPFWSYAVGQATLTP